MFSAPPTPAEATTPSEASQVITIAKAQRGGPWRYGATGPSSFDCSGLVIYAYKQAGDLRLIGNASYRSAASLFIWVPSRYREPCGCRGLISTHQTITAPSGASALVASAGGPSSMPHPASVDDGPRAGS